MTLATGAFTTFSAIGRREDLTDVIYNISPTETPFMSAVARGKATGTKHEWQTDALAAAAQNKQLEGDDAPNTSVTATVRLNNYCQISSKTPRVTGTQRAVISAGRSDELDYQTAKMGLELRRDMENDLLANNAANAGNSTTARVSAGVQSFLAQNSDKASDGSDPVGDGTNTRTAGTARAFTETMLKNVIQNVWTQGGNPNRVLVNAFQKRQISAFTGGATRYKEADDKKLVAAVDVYVSDWGELDVTPDRFMPTGVAYVVEDDLWSVAFLRPFFTYDLAKTGDTDSRDLRVEYTLEARQQKGNGIVADLTTS